MKICKFLFVVMFFNSCSKLVFKPKGFNYLYDMKYTGLDTIVRLGGYYISDKKTVMTKRTTDVEKTTQTVSLIMLYEDGTIIKSGSKPDVDDIKRTVDNDISKEIKGKNLQYSWGIYRLFNDTIKVQFIDDYGPMMSPGVSFKYYEILADTIISEIYEKELSIDYVRNDFETQRKYTFVPYPNRIDSTSNPHLKRKWFWEKKAYKNRKKNNYSTL